MTRVACMDRVDGLPAKFNNSIINHSDFKDKSLQSTVNQLFTKINNGTAQVHYLGGKDYVKEYAELPGWIVKEARTGLLGANLYPDTHVYRVRKAEKIQRLIDKFQLGDDVVVPKKYLYFSNGKWYVIAQKLDLSPKTPSLYRPYWEKMGDAEQASAVAQGFGEQLGNRIIEGRKISSPHCQAISAAQARAAAILAFDALQTDLTSLNMFFSADGKLAILDTEPVKRYFCKLSKSSIFTRLFTDQYIFRATQAMLGTAKFKLQLSKPDARKAVEKVENYYLAISLIRAAGVITCSIIAFRWVGSKSWSRLITYPIKTALIIKIVMISLQSMSLLVVTGLGRTKDGTGVGRLAAMEQQGQL